MIKDVVNIREIMTVIVAVILVLGLALTTLILGIGSGLIDQTGHHNQQVLAETNLTNILKSSSTGKMIILQAHAVLRTRR